MTFGVNSCADICSSHAASRAALRYDHVSNVVRRKSRAKGERRPKICAKCDHVPAMACRWETLACIFKVFLSSSQFSNLSKF